MPKTSYNNVVILFIAQMCTFAISPTIIFTGGLIGSQLTNNLSLATIPIAVLIVGTASFTYLGATIMKRLGRKTGFLFGNSLALMGIALSLVALSEANFVLFCFAVLLMGFNMAFMQQYRFAVTEGLPDRYKNRCVSFLILSGVFGTVVSLQLIGWSKALTEVDYFGSYVFLGFLLIIAHCALWFFRNVETVSEQSTDATSAPEHQLKPLSKSNKFLFGVMAGAFGYMFMSFIMTATPLYMKLYLNYTDTLNSLVIQSHIAAMFLPSLFSGFLLDKIGTVKLIRIGILLNIVAVVLNSISDNFSFILWGLIFLGVAWNFLFISSTAYLTKKFSGANKFKAQGINEFFVFSSQAVLSLLSGWLLASFGWVTLNWLLIPILIFLLVFSFKKDL